MNIETIILVFAIGYIAGVAHGTRSVYLSESRILDGDEAKEEK